MRFPDGSIRVLAIAGSLRRDGYNGRLLDAAARIAPAHVHVVRHDLRGVPLFDEDLERATGDGPDGVRALREAVAGADGVLIATPEYNQSIPGVLKNALDWLSRPAPVEVLVGKPVAILGASPGRWGTRLAQAALRQVLAATESAVLPAPMLFVRDAAQAFDANGALVDAAVEASLHRLLDAFAGWIDALHGDAMRAA
ncbi:NAD(P)H-dependent oxidoreductase [Dokdonella sp.]|uniref:NADPH-dependent FMN reductase n=1 Tax=Dokdonella sp. TaxID=2291710 RepID=UPI001B209BAF|nr:NAD(P)H-dependent oxidoreductase [Dokdonella sp.]MBO9661826.1 NAD(P)H-dependent oxidoreductase [Dokdonella sp.]